MLPLVLPLLSVPSKLAVFLVLALLIHGLLFRQQQQQQNNGQRVGGVSSSVTGATQVRRPVDSPSTSSTSSSTEPPPPVHVQVYVEALCIDSQRFVVESLVPTFHKLGPLGIMTLDVVVFGNARIDAFNHTLTCQHGPAECDANSYQQCATLQLYPVTERYLPFVACLFRTLKMGYRNEPFDASVFAACAQQTALDWQGLSACHDNADLAWQLQQEAASWTPTEHDHVPWVVVNGQVMDEEQQNLYEEVCRQYGQAGGRHPACDPGLLWQSDA